MVVVVMVGVLVVVVEVVVVVVGSVTRCPQREGNANVNVETMERIM